MEMHKSLNNPGISREAVAQNAQIFYHAGDCEIIKKGLFSWHHVHHSHAAVKSTYSAASRYDDVFT